MSLLIVGGRIGCALERGESVSPEAIEIRAERRKPFGVDTVEPAVADLSNGNKSGLFQDPEVLRNRRTADREAARQSAYGEWSVNESLEDRAAGRVAERVELSFLVSVH